MANNIVPRKRTWTRQPQHPTGIDWSNPITRGLVVSWVPSGVFSSQGRLNPTASSGPGVLSPGQFGIGNTFGQTGFELPVSPVDTLKSSDQTYLIIGGPPPNIQWNMCITTGSGSFRIWNGAFAIHIYPSSVCYLASSAQWASLGIVVARIRSDKTGRSFIVDNVEKTNLSTENSPAYDSNRSQLFQGANGDRTSATYWANKTFLAVKFDRYLSDKEVKSLTDNPWQIFKPRTRYLFTTAGEVSASYTITPTGSIVLSGETSQIKEKLFTCSGTVTYTGNNSLILSQGSTDYTITPTGNITYTGTYPIRKVRQWNPSGVITYSGTVSWIKTKVQIPNGEITFNGTASFYIPGSYIPTTSVLLTGVGK